MSETFQTTTVRTARRVRHETKMRLLQVREVSRLTPKMVRVVVGGEALAGFISAAHDDHVKLFFPQPGHDKPVLPTPTPNGPVYPKARRVPPRATTRRAATMRRRMRSPSTLCCTERGRRRPGRRRLGPDNSLASAGRAVFHRAR